MAKKIWVIALLLALCISTTGCVITQLPKKLVPKELFKRPRPIQVTGPSIEQIVLEEVDEAVTAAGKCAILYVTENSTSAVTASELASAAAVRCSAECQAVGVKQLEYLKLTVHVDLDVRAQHRYQQEAEQTCMVNNKNLALLAIVDLRAR